VTRLVYFEDCDYINEASTREKEVKALTRKEKIRLIESMNPEWKDLSEQWHGPR
jgi:putative endonuclease